MARVWLVIFLVAWPAWAQKWNIFGPDERLVLTASQWPSPALGQVSGRLRCTGTLVGERIVLTAAHCLRFLGTDLDPARPVTFAAQVQGGVSAAVNRPQGIAVMAGAWRKDDDPRSEDWAVLALSEAPLGPDGTSFRWLDVRPHSFSGGDLISTAGYSNDIQGGKSPSVHTSCQVRDTFPEGFFFHDCDVYAGASGGPILLDFLDRTLSRAVPFVVGITNSHFSDGTPGLSLPAYSTDRANVGATSNAFYPAVLEMRRRHPGRAP